MDKNTNWHKKIAQNRGERWLQNLEKGRREAQLEPTEIRLIRMKKGLKQCDVVESLTCSSSTYGSIERGRRLARKSDATIIANVLNAPINTLFETVGEKYRAKFYLSPQENSTRKDSKFQFTIGFGEQPFTKQEQNDTSLTKLENKEITNKEQFNIIIQNLSRIELQLKLLQEQNDNLVLKLGKSSQ